MDELRTGSVSGEENVFDPVLSALTANRLVTLSDEARRVDLSHESLIRGWPRLHTWIDGRRAAELTRRRLEEKADERLRLRKDHEAGAAAGLLDAVELAEAEAWVKGPDAAELGVSDDLAALVADSRQAIDATVLREGACCPAAAPPQPGAGDCPRCGAGGCCCGRGVLFECPA